MKKIVSIFIALTMLLCAVSAFATEAAPAEATEVNWSDLQEQGAALIAQGDFVTLDEISVKFWVPNSFSAVELTDDDRAQGYIAYFVSADQAYAVSVMYIDANGLSLDDYKVNLAEYGATEMEDVTINGMSALSYVLEGTDTACVSFATEAGYILEFAGAPKSDEGFAAVLAFIMASIQPEE